MRLHRLSDLGMALSITCSSKYFRATAAALCF